jgi:AbrB family looped-hinge helix DNA binding protein
MSTYVALQKRGVIALPLSIRKRFGLDTPGAQLEIIEQDGEIILRPHLPIPADQTWFWTPEWQTKEREVDSYRQAGNVNEFETDEAFLQHLDTLEGTSETS